MEVPNDIHLIIAALETTKNGKKHKRVYVNLLKTFLTPESQVHTVDAKIMCQFSHHRTIAQRCNHSYKTGIKWHSVKHTTGFVWPYHFIKTVSKCYCQYYPYG